MNTHKSTLNQHFVYIASNLGVQCTFLTMIITEDLFYRSSGVCLIDNININAVRLV